MDELLENPTAEMAENDGQEGVVDPQDTQEIVETEDGEAKREDGEQPELAARERVKQSHEDNAAARAARLRAQQETEGRLRAEYDAKVSGMHVVNPYTGKLFSGFADFEEYAKRFQREQDVEEGKRIGKSPEEIQEERENKAYLARKRQEEQQQTAEAASAQKQKQFLAEDLALFLQENPGVDVGKLEANQKFRKFAGKRLYKEPLSELYRDFVELVSDTEKSAAVKAAGKQSRGTGSGGSGELIKLTPAQDQALEQWNRENPYMKMTAKEYLDR